MATTEIKCGDCNKFYLCTTCGEQCGSNGHYMEIDTEDSYYQKYQEFLESTNSKISFGNFKMCYEIVYHQIEKELKNLQK